MPEAGDQRGREERAGIALGAWALAAALALALAWSRGRVEWTDARRGDAGAATYRWLIDPNTADEKALRLLPGIGPGLARRIVADREANGAFASVEDLARVPGIGESAVRGMAPHLAVRSAPAQVKPE